MEELPIFPLFLNCGTKSAWTAKNKQANDLLGYACEGADTYSNPIIDKDGKYWFIVNAEVQSLVDLSLCVTYENINL